MEDPVEAYDKLVSQISDILADEDLHCEIDGVKKALERIDFHELYPKNGDSEIYLDADDEFILILTDADWMLYQQVEHRNLLV